MSRKPSSRSVAGKRLVKAQMPDGLMNARPVSYPVAHATITALQVYHNPERKPSGDGPWNDEADKVSWVDDETGLGCIMLRQTDGTISGYVGVGPAHPLFGYEADAVPVGVSGTVHGGVTYGRECEANRFERRAQGKPRQERYTVCHTTFVRTIQEYRTVRTTEDDFDHEDHWWFGFDTSHPGDLVPKARHDQRHQGDVYRDQGFVYMNCIALARKLRDLGGMTLDDTDEGSGPPLLPSPKDSQERGR
ncbi:hypothetical protein [Qipengyuania spongiae]|uniref:Uncharacterized protein n=1 Tax=Qipengyuania spongiae TaxID=2909673 RepID=A0ABY5SZA1_9SPHN|nr:hypothetical protein [Qipengyuania spongiae]UVI38401.1 hypothetical protein L1F33_09015 [Qipengyuania spongiae]